MHFSHSPNVALLRNYTNLGSLDPTCFRYKGVFEHLASKGVNVHTVGLNAVVDGTVPIGQSLRIALQRP